MRLFRTHTLLLCLAVPYVAADLSTCTPFGDADRAKLAGYVHFRHFRSDRMDRPTGRCRAARRG